MHILRKTLRGIGPILKSELIRGRKELGRGAFTIVYEGDTPDTVLKMTIDDVAYSMLNDGVVAVGEQNPHFVRVKNDYYELGEVNLPHGDRVPVYAFECERLFKTTGETRALARKITAEHLSLFQKINTRRPTQREHTSTIHALERQVERNTFGEEVTDALDRICTFLSNYGAGFADLHSGNFMQRSDGTLVFSDPVCNLQTYKKFFNSLM